MTLDEAIKHCEEVADGMTEQGKCTECAAEHRQLAEWLKELKQLREQVQWIPVSERLPEEYERVIVFDVFGSRYIGEFIDAEESWGGKHFINEHGMHSKSVIAWMSLPEPYKVESEV